MRKGEGGVREEWRGRKGGERGVIGTGEGGGGRIRPGRRLLIGGPEKLTSAWE